MVFSNFKNMHIYRKTVKHIQVTRFQIISKNKTKRKSKCAICLTKRTLSHEIKGKYDLESELEIYLQFFTDRCYRRNMETYCVKCRKNSKNLNSKIFKTKMVD